MFRLNEKLRNLQPYDARPAPDKIHLDANESFVSLPPWMLEKALQNGLSFNRYPDPAAGELCRAFAARYGIGEDHVAAGNGSDELISVLFLSFLEKGDSFATLDPDFSMYAFNGFLNEARHVSIPKKDFRVDVDDTIDLCRREDVKLLIFSNPCNPTSIVLSREEIRRLVRGISGLVVLDEAYMDFSDQSLLAEVDDFDNLLILRTCSKALGLAALRLGFAVGRPELIRAVKAAKSPYNVNSLSQALGAAVLGEEELLDHALRQILRSRESLLAGLKEIGARHPGRFILLPCATNFAALSLSDGQRAYDALWDRGVAVRLTGGLLRVTCGTPEENEAFLAAFSDYLREE